MDNLLLPGREFLALIAAIVVGVLWMLITTRPASRYPDGKCYLCRSAPAMPGDTCHKCGTEQPL